MRAEKESIYIKGSACFLFLEGIYTFGSLLYLFFVIVCFWLWSMTLLNVVTNAYVCQLGPKNIFFVANPTVVWGGRTGSNNSFNCFCTWCLRDLTTE